MNHFKVQLEVNLLLDKSDLNCEEEDPFPDKEKIANYLNRKLRTDNDLFGKLTEKNIKGILDEKIQKSIEG